MKEIRHNNDFNFEKKGLEFKFKNPSLNSSDYLVLDWRVVGSSDKEYNNYSKDNYFSDAQFDIKRKAILCNFTIKKNKATGVGLPDEVYENLCKVYDELKSKRKALLDKAVNDLVEGNIYLEFSIVGCDYPQYQPWLKDIDDDLKDKVQNIMEKAILKLTGEKYISNSCEYIERKLKQSIGTKEDIDLKAFNLEFNAKTQNYHSFKETIVTNFKMKLADAIKLQEILAIKTKREAERKAIFDKAKETGEKQVLNTWSEKCNDPKEECDVDIITVYALPNGKIEEVRNHTW